METTIIVTTLVLLFSVVFFIVKRIREMKIPPDPWDGEEIDIDEKDPGVCVNCATPIKDKRQHYCPKCGNVTGQFTRYIPFVNIQFNYSIFGTVFKKFRK